MDYEKEYKSLVAKVKKAHLFAQTDSTKSVLEDILPELKESEDEIIRKGMIRFLESEQAEGIFTYEARQSWIAYLEKQKEQKPELVQQPPITYTYPSDASRDERLKAAILALLNSDLIKVAGNKFTKQDLIEWVERIPTDKRDCKDCAMFLNGKCTKPHWKPSEEQMNALNALNCHGDLSYVGQQNQLISLYNDLKKLI